MRDIHTQKKTKTKKTRYLFDYTIFNFRKNFQNNVFLTSKKTLKLSILIFGTSADESKTKFLTKISNVIERVNKLKKYFDLSS